MIKAYYTLAKPGIVYGNLLAGAAGYFFGVQTFELITFLAMLLGLGGIIACGCVVNNILDRRMDARMTRTQTRAIPMGTISLPAAAVFAAVLGIAGAALLYVLVNATALVAALVGLFMYVCLYTPLKPRSALALYVGAVSGAMPPVVGYAAATGAVDMWAALLFAVLYVWQIPHFLAIATYRFDEYAAAGVPLAVRPPSEARKKTAKKVFNYSLVVLLVLCLMPMLQMWMR